MKISMVTVETKKEPWHEEALSLYNVKINALNSFEIYKIKSKKSSRKDQQQKIKEESGKILSQIQPGDFVILLDEKGQSLDSKKMASYLQHQVDSGIRSLKFIIGGAFGVSEEVRSKANATWSLSHLTMNHFVAQVVLVEQIYRSLTIQKGIPYHNE